MADGSAEIAMWKATCSPYVSNYRGDFNDLSLRIAKRPVPLEAAGCKTALDGQTDNELGGVIFPGFFNADGRANIPTSSYRRAYAEVPQEGLVAASRDFGIDGKERAWHPPRKRGVTHHRLIAHEPDEHWATSIQTSYGSMAPDTATLKRTLDRSLHHAALSQEMAKCGGPLPYEEAEQRWRRWYRKRAPVGLGASSCADSIASTMPAGAIKPNPPEQGFTRIEHGKPLLSEEDALRLKTRGPRGLCGGVVEQPGPEMEAKRFTVLLPSMPKNETREVPADPKWSGRFRSLVVARRPRISAMPHLAMSRRGEDLS